ncbi:MAG TPA: GIY-YIG nuclease family protein [Prolixibacteraceae bacterium]|nr:GIY-YIG nuclease family protein [Prolixibacteraceae bacterium]
MSAFCYILFSKSLDRFYVGVTHETPDQRLYKHNKHVYGMHRFTASADDWEIFMVMEVENYPHAVRLERKIIAMKRTCLQKNSNTFEKTTCDPDGYRDHPDENQLKEQPFDPKDIQNVKSSVWMKSKIFIQNHCCSGK